TSSYTWQTGDQPATRHFKIAATPVTRNNVLRLTDVLARQDGSSRAARAVNISYNLNMDANVEVRILGANGLPVRTIVSRATRAAGIGQTTWDQKNDQGIVMPVGAYTVEIKAQTTDGQVVRAIAPVLVIR